MSVWKDYVGASDEQDTRRRRLHDDEKGERADRRRALFESAAAAVVFLAVGTLLGAGLLSTATATLRDEKSHELVRLASAATSTIDGDLHKTLTDPSMIDGPVYNRAIAALKQMARATPDIKYMYTAVLDGADIRLVLDAAEPGDNDNDGLEDRSGVWELYNDADPSMLHALGDGTVPGEATCTGQTYTDKWGTFIGGYAPIFDSNGVQVGVVGVDIDAAGYLANLADSRNHILYGAIPAVILSLGAAMSWCVLRLRLLRTDRMLTSTLAGDRDLAMTLAREMTADLAAAKEEAEAGSRAKSQFLANMSHEIRTPLTAILGYADLLHEEGDLSSAPASRIRNLNTIRSAGQHLMSVINNILDLSKIEADKMIVHRTETPLMDILTEVQSFMRSRAKEKGITLCMDLQTPVPDRIISEPTHLRQIITNLVANAVKFTEAGSVQIRVRAAANDTGPRLHVEIDDTGPGMTAEQARVIFDPFTQGDSGMARKFGGTGLGLTISRKLAERMGGTVTVGRTELGKGSMFRLDLPLEAAPGAAMTTTTGKPDESAAVTPAPPTLRLTGRILLAEDGADNQRLLSYYLNKSGAEVDVAENGVIALRMIDQAIAAGTPYDLLLTDMQMPEMDGYTLASTLRNRGSRQAIIALTAHAMAEDRDKCLAAGCDDFSTKPVDKASLLAMCGAWMGKSSVAAWPRVAA